MSRQLNVGRPNLLRALQNQDIRFSLECCSAKRLSAIATQEPRAEELCFLHSQPGAYQQFFEEQKYRP